MRTLRSKCLAQAVYEPLLCPRHGVACRVGRKRDILPTLRNSSLGPHTRQGKRLLLPSQASLFWSLSNHSVLSVAHFEHLVEFREIQWRTCTAGTCWKCRGDRRDSKSSEALHVERRRDGDTLEKSPGAWHEVRAKMAMQRLQHEELGAAWSWERRYLRSVELEHCFPLCPLVG